jgi:glutathione S-transferase
MIETQQRLEEFAQSFNGKYPIDVAPTLDIICAVVLYDYQQLRYADQGWLPQTPALKGLAEAMRQRASFADTMPRIV